MPDDNEKEEKPSKSSEAFRIIVGLVCSVIFLFLVMSGDFGALFDVTPGGQWLDGIPLFMILLLGIVIFIFPLDNKKSSKKNTTNDH